MKKNLKWPVDFFLFALLWSHARTSWNKMNSWPFLHSFFFQIFFYWPSRPLLNLSLLNYRWTFTDSYFIFSFAHSHLFDCYVCIHVNLSEFLLKSSSRRRINLLTFFLLELSAVSVSFPCVPWWWWWLWCVKFLFIWTWGCGRFYFVSSLNLKRARDIDESNARVNE